MVEKDNPALKLPKQLMRPYKKDDSRNIYRLPFMASNIVDTSIALEQVQNREFSAESSIFLGVAGLNSLNFIVSAGIGFDEPLEKAILFDQNRRQIQVMNALLLIGSRTPKNTDFINQAIDLLHSQFYKVPRYDFRDKYPSKKDRQTNEDRNFFAVLSVHTMPKTKEELRDYFSKQIDNPLSFVNEKRYKKFHRMAKEGSIATMLMDMRDKERLETLSNWLNKNNFSVDLAYFSTALVFLGSSSTYFSQANTSNDIVEDSVGIIDLLSDKALVLQSYIPGIYNVISDPSMLDGKTIDIDFQEVQRLFNEEAVEFVTCGIEKKISRMIAELSSSARKEAIARQISNDAIPRNMIFSIGKRVVEITPITNGNRDCFMGYGLEYVSPDKDAFKKALSESGVVEFPEYSEEKGEVLVLKGAASELVLFKMPPEIVDAKTAYKFVDKVKYSLSNHLVNIPQCGVDRW